ncbi:diguanylate cyclase [Patulibacter sp.]|uniref:diguanylate cyclase n=1 Tax=Patulibacter sp. TaxID=1912859 RepID=UPI00271D2D5A|nr:diguanylate cyclase [Patulibacter sp.]MDO9408248.1 diguanylate cyclase [Patulibacter sp.]
MHGGSASHLSFGVDPGVAIVSFIAAVVTAFVALEIAARALRAPERRRRPLLVVSGLTMGGGIWGMHFLAMLGMRTEMDMSYRLDLVVLSILFAAAGSTVALAIVARARVTRRLLVLAASFMGLAVSAMHYTGMASLQTTATQSWSPLVVAASVVVAFFASLLALGAVASMHGERSDWSAGGRLGAAIGLGVAVAGLHYTGMAAVSFHEGAAPTATAGGIDVSTTVLATVLGAAACVLLMVVTIDGARHRRRADLAGDLAVFARVSRDIGRRGDARRTVCLAAEELIGCDLAMLLEPDGDGALVVRATSGDPVNLRVGSSPGSSVCGDVLRSATRRFVTDVRTDAVADDSAADTTGVVSMLFEPVLLDDRPIAVLVAGWTERVESPGERRLAISSLLAAEAAVAIERADLVARLREQALVDGLTGLPNRRALDEALDQGVRRAGLTGRPITVAMVDVDRFKAYNDAHGHPEGDRLLSELASSWRAELRGHDIVGRFGGEEFLLVLPGVGSNVASRVIERLRGVMPVEVTCSFGVATWDGAEGASALVGRADAALYEAKEQGRDRVVVG